MNTSAAIKMNTSAAVLNSTTEDLTEYGLSWDDATWVLIASFIIFTMQSGFGLLEAGTVSCKNEVNIMYKITMDVVIGGFGYYLFGYAFSFGHWPGANGFIGLGDFVIDIEDAERMGHVYVTYIFQLSFAATATTIVSGAVAERIKIPVYIIYCFFNIFTYSVVAHWIWDDLGFLRRMGVIDIAGSGVVHLGGGVSALVAAYMLGPRNGRYDNGYEPPPLGNGANVALGTIMLWWGWLGFNCGSTFGVQGGKWKLAARAAVTTVNGAIGGGLSGVLFSLAITKGKYFQLVDMCNGVLGGLVSITASCAVCRTWEALIMGLIGGLIADASMRLFDRLKIDDPVGAIAVHGCCGVWGMLAVGLFVEPERLAGLNNGLVGGFYGGGGYAFGIQLLAVVCIIAWSGIMTFIIFTGINMTIGIRMTPEEEEIGADQWRHNCGGELPPDEIPDYLLERRQSHLFGGAVRSRSGTVDSAIRNRSGTDESASAKPHLYMRHNQTPGEFLTIPPYLRERRTSSFLGLGKKKMFPVEPAVDNKAFEPDTIVKPNSTEESIKTKL